MKINPNKIKKMSRYLRIVVNVFFWVTISMGIFFSSACIFILTNILKVPASGNLALVLDGTIYFHIESNNYDILKIKPVIGWLMLLIFFAALILSVILKQVGNILKTVENDCPFEEANSKRLTIIGFTLLLGSIVLNLIKSAYIAVIVENFKISGIIVNHSADGTMMLVGFLVLILAGVFQYGNYLQKEYDATL